MGPRGSRLYNFLNAQWLLAAKDAPPADDPAIVPGFTDDPAQPRLLYRARFLDRIASE